MADSDRRGRGAVIDSDREGQWQTVIGEGGGSGR